MWPGNQALSLVDIMEKKPHFLGLRTVAYYAPDIAAAKAWYVQALGIEPYFDEPFYVGFDVGGYELGLQPEEENMPQEGRTGVVAYWGVDDVEQAFVHLLGCGATTLAPPEEVGGGIIVASVLDPFGNALGVIYNPHFRG